VTIARESPRGADPIETRRGFAELFDRIEDHAVRVVKQK
jgi:hypothetical protein